MVWKDPERAKEYYREHSRQWREDHPDYNRNWRKNHPDYHHNYRKRHPERIKEKDRKYNLNNVEKLKVGYFVRNRKHLFPLASECELCPDNDAETTDLLRHHPDYEFPEIYVTVCRSCHWYVHAQNNRGEP